MRTVTFISTLLLLFFIGCNNVEKKHNYQEIEEQSVNNGVIEESKELSKNEYINWVDKNLTKKKELKNISYELKYTPVEYKLLKNTNYTDKNKFNNDIKDYKDSQYFTFKIMISDEKTSPMKYNLNTEQEYFARVEYLSFGIINDIYMIDDQDTLSCQLNYFERNYDLAPYIIESLTFELKNSNYKGDKLLIYNDRLFGNGIIKFRFNVEELKRTPKVNIEI